VSATRYAPRLSVVSQFTVLLRFAAVVVIVVIAVVAGVAYRPPCSSAPENENEKALGERVVWLVGGLAQVPGFDKNGIMTLMAGVVVFFFFSLSSSSLFACFCVCFSPCLSLISVPHIIFMYTMQRISRTHNPSTITYVFPFLH